MGSPASADVSNLQIQLRVSERHRRHPRLKALYDNEVWTVVLGFEVYVQVPNPLDGILQILVQLSARVYVQC